MLNDAFRAFTLGPAAMGFVVGGGFAREIEARLWLAPSVDSSLSMLR